MHAFAPALLLFVAMPASAQTLGSSCTGDVERMRACLMGEARHWETRMASALARAAAVSTAAERPALAAAQAAWGRWRDAQCRFEAAADTPLRAINALECARRMTQARAIDLDALAPAER